VTSGIAIFLGMCLKRAHQKIDQVFNEKTLFSLLLAHCPFKWALLIPHKGKLHGTRAFFDLFDAKLKGVLPLDSLRDFISSKEWDTFLQNILNLESAGKPFEQVVFLRKKETSLSLAGHCILTPFGKQYVVWAKTSVYAIQAEKKRREEIKGLIETFDLLPFPVWLENEDQEITFSNQRFHQVISHNSLKLQPSQTQIKIFMNNDDVHTYKILTLKHENHKVLKIAVDTTQLENSQYALKKSKKETQNLLDQLTAGITIYDKNLRVRFFNHAYSRLFDLDEKWLSLRPSMGDILDRLHENHLLMEQADFPSYKKKRLHMFTALMKPYEELQHLPDNRTLRMTASPYMDGVVLVFEDVTDRYLLERQMNTQLAVQKETLDNLFEGIIIFSSDHCLKFVNPAFMRLWDLPASRASSGTHIKDIMEALKPLLTQKPDWVSYRQALIDTITDRVPKSGKLKRTDDRILEFIYIPLPDGAHLISYTNITDTHRIDQVMRENEKVVEKADNVKSNFLSAVSYDLKSPLNTIIGFAEILSQGYLGQLTREQHAHSQGIVDSAQGLLSVVNNILDLASVEAGCLKLNIQPVRIQDFLDLLSKSVQPSIAKYGLKFSTTRHTPQDIFHFDEHRLKQVLLHLMYNSVRETPEGGEISVDVHTTDTHLQISVSDTGVGIPKDTYSHVFGTFEKESPKSRAGYPGSGLGLPLVKSFIELHGGHVDILSHTIQGSKMKGTKVICEIPLDLPQSSQQELLPIV